MKVSALTDEMLESRLKARVSREHEVIADVIEDLAEVIVRKLFLGAGCASPTAYTVERLGYSRDEGGRRVTAAKLATTYPVIITMLRAGQIDLSTLREVGPILTAENHLVHLQAAVGKSRFQLQEMVADLKPKPDVPTSMTFVSAPERKLFEAAPPPPAPPAVTPVPPSHVPERPAPLPKPLGNGRYDVELTADLEMHADLMWLRDNMRHSIPDGDCAKIMKRAVKLLREKVEAQKLGKLKKAAPETPPSVPANTKFRRSPGRAQRRAVVDQSDSQCCFVGADGHRCTSTAWLEFEHRTRVASGGDTDVANLQLMCRAHNQYKEDLYWRDTPQGGSAAQHPSNT